MADVSSAPEHSATEPDPLPSSQPSIPGSPSLSSSSSFPPAPPSSSPAEPVLSPVSSALFDVISPALSNCDAAISSVFSSQDALAAQIDALAGVLASFHSLQQAALFAPYTQKLQAAKKRITRLQANVERINERMDEMRDMVRRKEGLDGHHSQRPTDLAHSLRGFTDKMATSFASLHQQRPPPSSLAHEDAAPSSSHHPSTPPADGDTSPPSADPSSTSSSTSADAPPSSTATIASNHALLHDLLEWDE